MLISVGIHCTPATLTFLLPLKHTRHSTSGLWTWRPFACNAIPSRQPAGTVPHLHGSIQVLHLYFKEAFLAPLPKLLPKLFPIVCVSLSCFFPLALTYFYIYIYTHTHTHTDTLYIQNNTYVHTKYIIQHMCINVKFTLVIISPQYIKYQWRLGISLVWFTAVILVLKTATGKYE